MEKANLIFWLKTLIELIENDTVRAADIKNLSVDELLSLAETEANKAKANADDLAAAGHVPE